MKEAQKTERNAKIYSRAKNGETYAAIGRTVGLTGFRIGEICREEKAKEDLAPELARIAKHGARLDDSVGLLRISPRSHCALQRLNIATVGQMLDWCRGHDWQNDFMRTKSVGRKSLAELREAFAMAGHQLPDTNKERVTRPQRKTLQWLQERAPNSATRRWLQDIERELRT